MKRRAHAGQQRSHDRNHHARRDREEGLCYTLMMSTGLTFGTILSIEEARVGVDRYHLVLLATRENPEAAIAFRREIRQQDPNQKVAFLVGPPDYLSFTFGRNLIPMPARAGKPADKLTGRLASA
jgi:hypothetical protein